MKHFLYYRVSTIGQDYIQQQNCVKEYLKRHNIIADGTTVEKVSGRIRYTDRELSKLIDRCKKGDVIYFSELSRLGRNMNDLSNVVNKCCEEGIMLVQCKDGMQIENNTIGGKALLFALSLAAEIEVNNIRQRTQMGLDARRKALEEFGYFVSNSGNVCKRFGAPKGFDMTAAREAAILAKHQALEEWKKNSIAFKWVKEKVKSKTPRKEIIEEFNQLHTLQPEIFSTRTGRALTKGVLSFWIDGMSDLVE